MKAFVLNLPDRTERWETFQQNWKDSGLDLIRVDATRMENVYHAVFLKHRELLTQEQDDFVLVLEDDAVPCKDFAKRWELITSYLLRKPDWDVVNGGMLAIDRSVEYITQLPDKTFLLTARRGCMGHFLWFRRESALKKMEYWETHGKPEYDAWYSTQLDCRATIPFLATQCDGHSDSTKMNRDWEDRFRMEEDVVLSMVKRFLANHYPQTSNGF